MFENLKLKDRKKKLTCFSREGNLEKNGRQQTSCDVARCANSLTPEVTNDECYPYQLDSMYINPKQ